MKQRVFPGRSADPQGLSPLVYREREVSRYRDKRKLTATFRSLLSLLPSFFGTNDEVLALMPCMVNLLLVMSFL